MYGKPVVLLVKKKIDEQASLATHPLTGHERPVVSVHQYLGDELVGERQNLTIMTHEYDRGT